jgi:general secretion pathway protein E
VEAARQPWPALGVLLIRDGLVTSEELEDVLARQGDDREHRISSQRLGEALVESGRVTSAQIARLVAEQHELPFVDLEDPDATVPVPVHLPEELARLHTALPVRGFPDGSLLVVIADPTRTGCFDDVRRALGVPVRFAVAAPDAIEAAIDAELARLARVAGVEDESQEQHVSTASAADDLEDLVAGQADEQDATTPDAGDQRVWPVLGSLLVRDGLVTEEELEAALAQQRLSSTRRLGEILVSRGSLTEAQVSRALAEQHELPFVDLQEHEIDVSAASRLPLEVARAHVALPISTLPDGGLLVAVADPASAIHSDELGSALGVPLQFAIAAPAEIDSAIDELPALDADRGEDEPVAIGSAFTPFSFPSVPELRAVENEDSLPQTDILGLDDPPELEVVREHELEPGHAIAEAEAVVELDAPFEEDTAPELELVAEEPQTIAQTEVDHDDEHVPEGETELEVSEPDAAAEVDENLEVDAASEAEVVSEPEVVAAETEVPADSAPVAEAIERALALGASAVHFVPRSEGVAVLGRIDGVLSELEAISPERSDDARNELAELTRRPLNTFRVGKRSLALRSAVLPTLNGDRATFRVVDEDARPSSFFELVVRTGAAEALQGALDRGSGLLVVSGPAGSGRTTTLRAALAELGCAHRAVLTIEDPVDGLVPGADQIEVDASRGLTLATGLRAILRSDPDVVLVGELVDPLTASLATRAASGGTLVLTTLEAESASAGVRRLLELGLDPASLSSALTGVVAQRLLRRVCVDCRESYYASAAELTELGRPPEELGRRLLGRGQGCETCDGSGYAGHVAVFEVLPLSDPVRTLVSLGASVGEIEHTSVATGMRTLFEDAVELCLEGVTTPAEVRRVPGA